MVAVACEREQEPTVPEQPLSRAVAAQDQPVVRDPLPRPVRPLDEIIADLRDPRRSDGTLLVGVKERLAVRGVGRNGVRLPRQDARKAQEAILGDFPDLELVAGVTGIVRLREPTRTRLDTVHRTWINVRAPADPDLLAALRDHPHVDYVEASRIDGIVLGDASDGSWAPIILLSSASTETRPWGVDSVRAPEVWTQGWRGGEINLGLVDTGVDIEPGGTCHPDFNCSKLYFYSTVDTFPGNNCTDPTSSCYYEWEYHGAGVLGAAIAEQDGVGSVGVAPSQTHSVYKTIVAKAHMNHGSLAGSHPQRAFADAVLLVSDSLWGIQVGVTALAYCELIPGNMQTLWSAFQQSYADGAGMLWFAGAGNTRGSSCAFDPQFFGETLIPGHFGEVVAVGAVSQDLTLAWYSANSTGMTTTGPGGVELLAPGGGDSDDGLPFPLLRVSWNRLNDDGGAFEFTKEVMGTSYAAPIAAGVARLALEYHPNWSAAQLRSELKNHGRYTDPNFNVPMVDAVCVVYQWENCQGTEPAQPPPDPLSVSIFGPTSIRPQDRCTWQADVSGGISPFSYEWFRKDPGSAWLLVGTSNSYTDGVNGEPYFDLKLEVEDSQGDFDWDRVRVDDNGTFPCLL
jgi:subtilisin